MKKFFIPLCLLAFVSCAETTNETTPVNEEKTVELEVKVDSLQQANAALEDSLNERIRTQDLIIEQMTVAEENEGWAKYEGMHSLTLQWIGWDNPGEIEFTLETEGEFAVAGEQRDSEGNYLTIDGVVTLQGENQLGFNGKIVSQIDHINGGAPCLKEGNFTFLATGDRQYWRLQEMDNCEGNNVVDYIDIYFK